MDTQNLPTAGPGTYVFKSRAEAARLAGRVLRAQQEAGNRKTSVLAVSWQIVKSGLTRQVTVPASTTVSQLSAMKEVESDLQDLVTKKLCTRKPDAFDMPPGFRWSHGNSKYMSRHIVVRHWVTPGVLNSSKHTALSMEDKLTGVNEYATWTPRKIRLIDWRVSKNPIKRLLAPLKMKVDDLTYRDFPISPPSYRDDKGLYLSDNTKFRLQRGEEARKKLADIEQAAQKKTRTLAEHEVSVLADQSSITGDLSESGQVEPVETSPPTPEAVSQGEAAAEEPVVTDQLLKKAAYRPLPYQKVSSKSITEWQRRAEKHYLPCIGHDKHRRTGKKRFVMFGLDLDKMRKSWNDVRNDDHPRNFYRQFSVEQNCSGMCLSLLKAGGADRFYAISPKLVTTQSDMEQYSARLVKKLDYLNACVLHLDTKLKLYKVPAQPSLSLGDVSQKLESLSKKYTMQDRWKQKIAEVVRNIRELEKTNPTVDELTPVAEKLTVSLVQVLRMTETNPYIQDRLESALHAFQLLKNSMESAYDQEHEEPSGQES